MSDLTPERLDQIEQAARKASSVHGRGWHTRVSLERDTHSRIPAWQPDAEHIANMDPNTTLALIAEVRRLRGAVERVRAVHWCDRLADRDICGECPSDEDGHYALWPCATIQALDGMGS